MFRKHLGDAEECCVGPDLKCYVRTDSWQLSGAGGCFTLTETAARPSDSRLGSAATAVRVLRVGRRDSIHLNSHELEYLAAHDSEKCAYYCVDIPTNAFNAAREEECLVGNTITLGPLDNMTFKVGYDAIAWCGMPKQLLLNCLESDVTFNPDKQAFDMTSTKKKNVKGVHEKSTYDIVHFRTTRYLQPRVPLWEFPVFDISVAVKGRPLTTLAYYLFKEENLFKQLKINPLNFLTFFRSLEEHYHPVPYHNRQHATDVLHAMAYLLRQPIIGFKQRHLRDAQTSSEAMAELTTEVRKQSRKSNSIDVASLPPGSCESLRTVLSPVQLAACFIAAAAHDCDHPGRTNGFFTATNHTLAKSHGKKSVLEKHHLAKTWRLLKNDSNNFLENVGSEDFAIFQSLLNKLILATDLLKKDEIETAWYDLITATKEEGLALQRSENTERLELVLQKAIRIADVAAPTKLRETHFKWAALLYEEFEAQAREERDRQLPVAEFMDPARRNMPRTQDSFIKAFTLTPLLSYSKAGLLPGPYVVERSLNAGEARSEGTTRQEDNSGELSGLEDELQLLVCSVIVENTRNNLAYWASYGLESNPNGIKSRRSSQTLQTCWEVREDACKVGKPPPIEESRVEAD